MELEDGMWVACILKDGQKAVGHVHKEMGTLYVNCITEENAVTTSNVEYIQSWCAINIGWEEESGD